MKRIPLKNKARMVVLLALSFQIPSNLSFGATQHVPVLIRTASGEVPQTNGTFYAIGSNLYFFGSETQDPQSTVLWTTNGTTAGTKVTANLGPIDRFYSPDNVTVVGSKLFYTLRSSDDYSTSARSSTTALWSTGVNGVGTNLIYTFDDKADLTIESADLSAFNGVGSGIFFERRLSATDSHKLTTELWFSDGSSGGTHKVSNIPETGNSGIGFKVPFKKSVILPLVDSTGHYQLWTSDGSETGTLSLVDLGQAGAANVSEFKVIGTKFFFTATDGIHGYQLWISDGTVKGTHLVKDINTKGDDKVGNIQVLGSNVYFTADDGVHGMELWISDGTAKGTRLVKDINPKGDSDITNPQVAGQSIYFSAYDGIHGKTALWVSNGTLAGTKMIKDMNLKGPLNMFGLIVVGKKLYFSADDAKSHQIWVSDGSSAGTHVIKDLKLSNIEYATVGGKLASEIFFTVRHGSDAPNNIWFTDGTAAGTQQVKFDSIHASVNGGATVLGSSLYYAYDGKGGAGWQVWKVS